MNDWLDEVGTQIDEIKWHPLQCVWVVSNAHVVAGAMMLGDALDKFQREWREFND